MAPLGIIQYYFNNYGFWISLNIWFGELSFFFFSSIMVLCFTIQITRSLSSSTYWYLDCHCIGFKNLMTLYVITMKIPPRIPPPFLEIDKLF